MNARWEKLQGEGGSGGGSKVNGGAFAAAGVAAAAALAALYFYLSVRGQQGQPGVLLCAITARALQGRGAGPGPDLPRLSCATQAQYN